MTNYKNLRRAIIAEEKARNTKAAYFIRNGYAKNWSEEQKQNADPLTGLKRYATDRTLEQLSEKAITRAEAVKRTVKREERTNAKRTAAALRTLEELEAATPTESITIYIEWKRSAVWGMNPNATIYTDNGRYYGHASGCGFSTIESILNACGYRLKARNEEKRTDYYYFERV